MINISIESSKLLLNEINQIENKNFFIIIIIRDALLSIGASNEEIANRDLYFCAGALRQALVYCVCLNAEPFSCTDSKHRSVVAARIPVVSTRAAIFFSSLIDGCLKYKNKEKRKTGLRPSPRLNYNVKIGPKPSPKGVKTIEAQMQSSRTVAWQTQWWCSYVFANKLQLRHAVHSCNVMWPSLSLSLSHMCAHTHTHTHNAQNSEFEQSIANTD